MHGTLDARVPYEHGVEIAATIPGARLTTYEGAGHVYMLHDVKRANAEVLSFLAEVDR